MSTKTLAAVIVFKLTPIYACPTNRVPFQIFEEMHTYCNFLVRLKKSNTLTICNHIIYEVMYHTRILCTRENKPIIIGSY